MPIPETLPIYGIDAANIQKVTVSGTHAETTNAVKANNVLIISSTDCHVLFADAPVATTNDIFIPKGVFVAFKLSPSNKVSIIQDSAGGTAWVVGLN